MSELAVMRCADCAWLKADQRPEYYGHGNCWRFPPQVVGFSTIDGNQFVEQHRPWMQPSDWCAEFVQRTTLDDLKARGQSGEGEGI